VRVHPERGRATAGVADPAGDRSHVHAAGDELGGRVVPQVVQPDPQPSCLASRPKWCVTESGFMGCRAAGSKENT
jgi:hypothetical protein